MKIIQTEKNLYTHLKISFILVLSIVCYSAVAQQKIGPDIYLIRFTDKHYNSYSLDKPNQFLSSKAIERRIKQNIIFADNDLPVSTLYLDSIETLGFKIIQPSKWFNAVSVEVQDASIFQKLTGISFIKPIATIYQLTSVDYRYTAKQPDQILPRTKSTPADYGNSYTQVSMHHGEYLHAKGFEGQGLTIAIFDGGFQNVKDFTSLQNLWFEQRVLQTRDYADNTGQSFYENLHGSNVLSVMAGIFHGELIGTAPKANYILVHTENSSAYEFQLTYEFPVEEFNWVVAAEFADSIGADIISSSLGYSQFIDPSLDYAYKQMDGKTALSSIGAKTAASKGMLVVSSAGNEGNYSWKYITAPADADSILTVGAIDALGNHASFSSYGPTADGRIKPDIVALGKGTTIQSSQNIFTKANGTSFSAPIISGLAACLWQAVPNASNMEIINAIKQSASQATHPDTITGYGIPNFKNALYLLNPAFFETNSKLITHPNPFTSTFSIEFGPIKSTQALFQVHNVLGKLIYQTTLQVDSQYPNEFLVSALNNTSKGLYILSIIADNTELLTNILKL